MVKNLKLKRNIQAFAGSCFALTGVGFIGYAYISTPEQQAMMTNIIATFVSVLTSYVCFVGARITNIAIEAEEKSKKYFFTSHSSY